MPETRTLTTACPRNCYSTSAMRVTVEDGRLRRIEPHPGNAATPNGTCLKELSYIERVYARDGLLFPLRRRQPAQGHPAVRVVACGVTFVASLLVAWLGASFLGGPRVRALPFLAAGVFGLALSTLHLGRRERAWRGVLNWRRSWLSREVIAFPAFVALAAGHLLLSPRIPGPVAAAVGLLALACRTVSTRCRPARRGPGSTISHSSRRPRSWPVCSPVSRGSTCPPPW